MKLILTHGLPGSGKSTWAIPYAQEHEILRLNRDELRIKIGGARYSAGAQDRKTEGRVSAEIMKSVKNELAHGRSVLVDDTHMNSRTIAKWVTIAQAYGATLEHVYFDVTLEEALANNARRERQVPEKVIRRMAEGAFSHDGKTLLRYAVSQANGTVSYLRDMSAPVEQALVAYNATKTPQSKHAVIFDMDGTLVDMRMLSDRYLSENQRNFHRFHGKSVDVPANDDVLQLAWECEEQGLDVVVVTARTSDYYEQTRTWLEKHDVPVRYLAMRGAQDFRPDYEVKSDIYEEIVGRGWEVAFSVDDNPNVIRLWETLGLNVVRVPFHEPQYGSHSYAPLVVPSIFAVGFCVRCHQVTTESALCLDCAQK